MEFFERKRVLHAGRSNVVVTFNLREDNLLLQKRTKQFSNHSEIPSIFDLVQGKRVLKKNRSS
jgi:hypothetical protein